MWASVKERSRVTWCPSLISQQLFALVMVPHSWVPVHLFHRGSLLPFLLSTTDIHQVHSGQDNFAFSSWCLPWQNLPSPRFCCLAETGPSLSLCHCPSLWDLHGGTAFSCDGEWSRKAQQLLLLQGGLFTHPSLCTRVWLGVPLAENSWAKETPGMLELCNELLWPRDGVCYDKLWRIFMFNNAKFCQRNSQGRVLMLCYSQLPLTDQNTTSQTAKPKMPHWGAVEIS